MHKGLWDRHGVNNANCYEGICGEKLQPFYQAMLIRGQCKILFK